MTTRKASEAEQFVPVLDDVLLDAGLVWLWGGREAEEQAEARREAYDAEQERIAREEASRASKDDARYYGL